MSAVQPSLSPLSIRDAQPADMAAVQAIYAHHVLHGSASFEEVPPDVAEMSQRHAAVVSRGLPFLVAEWEQQVVGYCYASLYRPRPAYRYDIEDSVYLHTDARGRGLGTALLTELIRRCELGPWRQMIAVVADSGEPASMALHQRLGFVQVGTLNAVGYKFGRWIDTAFLQRPLNSGQHSAPEQ